LGSGHTEHGDGAEQHQAGIGLARAEAVAQGPDYQTHHNGDGHSGNIDIGDLPGAEIEFTPNHRHQRGAGKPGKEADEERHPGEMEDAGLDQTQIQQLQAGSFIDVHGEAGSSSRHTETATTMPSIRNPAETAFDAAAGNADNSL